MKRKKNRFVKNLVKSLKDLKKSFKRNIRDKKKRGKKTVIAHKQTITVWGVSIVTIVLSSLWLLCLFFPSFGLNAALAKLPIWVYGIAGVIVFSILYKYDLFWKTVGVLLLVATVVGIVYGSVYFIRNYPLWKFFVLLGSILLTVLFLSWIAGASENDYYSNYDESYIDACGTDQTERDRAHAMGGVCLVCAAIPIIIFVFIVCLCILTKN